MKKIAKFVSSLRVWKFKGVTPVVHASAYVHPSAVLIGDVHVGANCYIGPCAVLRGDNGPIRLLEGVNVQDGCVVHGAPGSLALIERHGHIGHGAVLHGCRIGPNAFVGINSVVMDHAVVGENAWVAAMSFVREGFEVPANMLAAGTPAQVIKPLTQRQLEGKRRSTAGYLELAQSAEALTELTLPLRAHEPAPLPRAKLPRGRRQALLIKVKRTWRLARQAHRVEAVERAQ